jgi:hypothetical protein
MPWLLYPGDKFPGTQWIEGWVGRTVSLHNAEKGKNLALSGIELTPSSL